MREASTRLHLDVKGRDLPQENNNPPTEAGPAASGRLGIAEKIAYGCGDLSSNLVWGMLLSYLMYYYTDIYLIPAALVAWLLLVPRVFDAFCDPLFGYIIDRTSGRYVRHTIGLLAVPFGVFSFLCFLPVPLSPGGKLVWAWGSYLALGAMFSAINTPYGVLSNMMTVSPQERVSLNSFRMAGCQIGQLTIAASALPAIALLGGGLDAHHQQVGIAIFSAIIAVVGASLWLFTWRGSKIRRPLPTQAHTLAVLLSALMRNRLWHIVNALMFLEFIVFCSEYGLAIHYTRFILHREANVAAIILTSATLAAVLGALAAPLLTNCLGLRRTYLVMLLFQLINLLIMLASAGRFTPFLVSIALQYIGVGVISPLCLTMLSDAIDYGRNKTGIASAGLAFSINTLVTKVAAGLTGFTIASSLAWGQYTPAMKTAGAALAVWLRLGFIGIPFAALCLAIPTLLLWPRDMQLPTVVVLPEGSVREAR
jgi:GPH family glycoside/pentoside/hexuronide:cation symporter